MKFSVVGFNFSSLDIHTIPMNIDIDEEPPIPDDLEPVVESLVSLADQSLLSAKRKIEQRRELLELRKILDDPLFDMDFD